MDKSKIVDLTHKIVPEKEHFKINVKVDDVSNVTPFQYIKHRPDVWYVVGEVTYCTHVGTHLEAPFHHQKDGADIADYPLRQLIGHLVVLDFRNKKNGEAITLEEIKAQNKEIKSGDIVFIWTGIDKFYHSDRWDDKPYITLEATNWLVERKIACLGADAADIEIQGTDHQPNHQALFNAGIAMVESLANLEQVAQGDYTVFIMPIPIQGLEASPARIIAIPTGERL